MKQIARLIMLFRPFWGWAVLGIILSLVTMLANITLLTTSAWFITAMGSAGLAGVSMNYFTPAALIRGAAIIRTGGRYAERLVTHEATFRFLSMLRLRTFKQFASMGLDEIEQKHSSDLASRVQYDIDALQGFYVRVLVPVTASVFAALLCIFYGLKIDFSVGGVIAVGLLCAGLVVPLVSYLHIKKTSSKLSKSAQELKEHSVDMIDGLGDLLVFGGLHDSRERFAEVMCERADLLHIEDKTGVWAKQVTWLLSQFTFLAVILLGADLLATNSLSQADFVMAAMFALASFESVLQLAPALMQIPQNQAALNRILIADTMRPSDIRMDLGNQEKLNIEVQNVVYRLNHQGRQLEYNFGLPMGGRLLITGPSGCGKSTLIDLLLGQRKPDVGQILINHDNQNDISGEQLSELISVASQRVQVFSGSLLENLKLGNREATKREITQALEVCELSEWVLGLPDGLLTQIGEQGFNLSGGQLRRLGVARALLKPSALLVLDEPGEGLDSETEQRMMQKVVKNLQGRSLIVISHRPLTAMNFDQVIHMKM